MLKLPASFYGGESPIFGGSTKGLLGGSRCRKAPFYKRFRVPETVRGEEVKKEYFSPLRFV